MKKMVIYVIIFILIIGNVLQFANNYTNYSFKFNAVPNEETALKIAETVLVAVYGEEVLLSNQPFKVYYNDYKKSWVIIGTLPNDCVGGVAKVVIRKYDGKVLSITHSM